MDEQTPSLVDFYPDGAYYYEVIVNGIPRPRVISANMNVPPNARLLTPAQRVLPLDELFKLFNDPRAGDTVTLSDGTTHTVLWYKNNVILLDTDPPSMVNKWAKIKRCSDTEHKATLEAHKDHPLGSLICNTQD